MEVRAVTKYVRISPRKARGMARIIRGLPVGKAIETMQMQNRKGARLVLKTLRSAVANAEKNAELAAEDLSVKEAVVESGPSLKRYRPCARGAAHPVWKRTSHIRVVLTDGAD